MTITSGANLCPDPGGLLPLSSVAEDKLGGLDLPSHSLGCTSVGMNYVFWDRQLSPRHLIREEVEPPYPASWQPRPVRGCLLRKPAFHKQCRTGLFLWEPTTTTALRAYSHQDSLPCRFEGWESETGLTGLKSRCWQSCVPFWKLMKRIHFLSLSSY